VYDALLKSLFRRKGTSQLEALRKLRVSMTEPDLPQVVAYRNSYSGLDEQDVAQEQGMQVGECGWAAPGVRKSRLPQQPCGGARVGVW
jgi:hypothetical protein